MTSFELVTDEAMEGKIIASRLTAQMMEELGSSFDGVRRVTQFLEGQDLLATDVLRPDTWCLRLIEAWEDAKWERGTLTLMRDCLLEQLGQLGRKAYEGIERFYEEKQRSQSRKTCAATASSAAKVMPLRPLTLPRRLAVGAVAGSLGASGRRGCKRQQAVWLLAGAPWCSQAKGQRRVGTTARLSGRHCRSCRGRCCWRR